MKNYISICLALLAIASASAQSYQVHFTQMTGCDYEYDTNTLSKPSPDSWSNSMAVSSNVVKTTTDPVVTYQVQNANSDKAFGWSSTYIPGGDLSDLKYGFYLENSILYVIENGRIKGRYGRVKAGDELSVSFRSNRVYFRLNGKYLTRVVSSSPVGMRVSAFIYNQDGDFQGLTSNVNHEYYLKGTSTDITQSSSGGMTLQSLGIVPSTESFFWGDTYISETDFNSELVSLDQDLISILGPDPYASAFRTASKTISSNSCENSRIFYLRDGVLVNDVYSVSYPMEFTYEKNAVVTNDRTITATSVDSEITHDAYWFYDESGWITSTIGGYSNGIEIGLVDVDNTTQSNPILYGWDIRADGLYVLDNGTETKLNHDVRTNDDIQIVLEKGEVIYKINGVEEVRYTLNSSVEVYQLTTRLKLEGSYLKKVGHSAKPYSIKGCMPRIIVEHLECDGSGEGSIYASFKGVKVSNCDGPFDFQLISTSQSYLPKTELLFTSFENLTAGVYNLNITNSLGLPVWNGAIDVGYKHDWIESEGAFSSDFPSSGYNELSFANVQVPGQPGIYYASGRGEGVPKLPLAQNGWLEVLPVKTANFLSAGFLNWTNNENVDLAKVGFALSNSNITYNALISGTSSGNSQGSLAMSELKSIKVRRDSGGNFSISLVTHTSTEILISQIDNPTIGLKGFLKILSGLKFINSYSSYPCGIELPLYAQMDRDLNGELHLMPISNVNVIYNEPYSATSIESLEVISDNEVIAILDNVPAISRGDNRWVFDLTNIQGIEVERIYTLRLKNLKEETYYLRILLKEL